MIAIVDYGLGNVCAFVEIYKRLNIEVKAAKTKEELESAGAIILPGVGSFDYAMSRLIASGMRETLDTMVLDARVPVLGVCVGMQIMARSSEEGSLPGLNWISGTVKRFQQCPDNRMLQCPHMGWNDVFPKPTQKALFKLENNRFYFLHSYYFVPDCQENVLATTIYGNEFASAICLDNIYGTQFHPEKSHHWGISLLEKFAAK
jgi:glutamine amidotransferase